MSLSHSRVRLHCKPSCKSSGCQDLQLFCWSLWSQGEREPTSSFSLLSSLTTSAFLFALSWHAGLVFTRRPLQHWDCETCRFEFEDKKEYLNELSKQQFDLAATTHYTTGRSQVRLAACLSAMSGIVIAELLHVAGEDSVDSGICHSLYAAHSR